MVDGRANIDLVFRNGLKDYEISPPSDVWTNIQPAIDRKKKYMFFLRSAASIAILISTGVFAYWWGYETSKERLSADVIYPNNELITPVDIAIPPAIIPDRTEPTKMMTVADAGKQEFETVGVSAVAQLDIPEIKYIEDFYVEESEMFVAESESFPQIQEKLNVNNAIAFSSEYQPIFYESVANVEDNRWSILAMASPLYKSQFTTSSNELSHQINNSDQGRASYSGGLGFAYKINKRFSIQSGLYYSAMGQELGDIVAHSGFQQVNPSKGSNNFKVLTSNGTVNVSNPDIYLGSYTVPDRVLTQYTTAVFDPNKVPDMSHLSNSIFTDLRYLELPLMLRYKAIDRKMGVSFVGGVSYNFLVSNSVNTSGEKTYVGKMEGLSDLSLSGSLGMGMEYKFSKNISFNVEPTFRYFLNTSNSGRIPGLHNYAIGVFSGMSYKF